MNATFVLDRSHSAILLSASHPKPELNLSLVRGPNCAPPERTEPKPVGRSDFLLLPLFLLLESLVFSGVKVADGKHLPLDHQK